MKRLRVGERASGPRWQRQQIAPAGVLRTAAIRSVIAACSIAAMCSFIGASSAAAQNVVAQNAAAIQEGADRLSVIDRLSGFDQDRIGAVGRWLQTPEDADLLAETAKLLFQVNRLAQTSLAAPPAGPAPSDNPLLKLATGDAVTIRGRATALASAPLPPDLAEVLELDRIYRVEVQTSYSPAEGSATLPAESLGGPTVYVLTSSVPASWRSLWAQSGRLDQPTAATGVIVQSDAQGRPRVIAAPGMAWFPVADSSGSQDWALLASQGFNASLLEDVRSLNRKPLLAADREAFYTMLRAAQDVASLSLPPPPQVDASELLRDAPAAVGRRVRLNCKSVRITRITLSDPRVQQMLGSDHYWQIDALGDLGNVVIHIEAHDGDSEPATFQNRYPVSIVTLTLPDFLRQQLEPESAAGNARSDLMMLSRELIVEGFFYRLWAYESDFMRQHGGGNQFGPLVMATRIIDAEPPPGDPIGVGRIGQAAAAAALVMLLATGMWLRFTARQDAAARARRRSQEQVLDLPAAGPPETPPAANPPADAQRL